MTNDWNSSETKPDEHGDYLVVSCGVQVQIAYWNGHKWVDFHRDSGLPLNITHWMLLPRPPEK